MRRRLTIVGPVLLGLVVSVALAQGSAGSDAGGAMTGGMGDAAAAMGGRTVSVTVTNTTEHQTFSAPVVLTHGPGYRPFALHRPVLPELVPLAEDGDPHDLVTVARVDPAVLDDAVAAAPLAPGASVTLEVRVDDAHPLVSAFGMLVSTNDAVFVFGEDLAMGGSDTMGGSGSMGGYDSMGGSDSMSGSDTMGGSDTMSGANRMSASGDGAGPDLYDGTVRVLDAGSEANTESCHDIPGPPCNHVGVRHTAMAEGVVTIHPGLKGKGDLDPAVYGWTDPVARVQVATP